MLSPVECLLKSENYTAAAQLDPAAPDALEWLELAAAWRAKAIELRCGSLIQGDDEFDLWNALTLTQ